MAKKPPVASEPEKTVSVTANTPIRYDGDDYKVGEVIDMRESCVAGLAEIGAITINPTPAPVSPAA